MFRSILMFGIRLLAVALLALPLTSFARWYETGTGRFLSEDPLLTDVLHVQGALGTPMSLGPWLYANGNPLTYTDPDGRQGLDPFNYTGVSHPINGLAMQCMIDRFMGYNDEVCRSPEAMGTAYSKRNDDELEALSISFNVNSLPFGVANAVRLGVVKAASAFSLGALFHLGAEAYEDPYHPKKPSELNFGAAALSGVQMCAVPMAVEGLRSTGWLGKWLVNGGALYLSGHAIAEGDGQFAVGVRRGDPWQAAYGIASVSAGVLGGRSVCRETTAFFTNAPQGAFPGWFYNTLQGEGLASGPVPPMKMKSGSKGKGKEVFRYLSPEDKANLDAGRGLEPKGDGGSIADHVAGKRTGHISASESDKAIVRFDSGNGLVAIDVDMAIRSGAKYIDHNNVVQAVSKDLKLRRDATRAEEVLFRGAIPGEAVRYVDPKTLKKR